MSLRLDIEYYNYAQEVNNYATVVVNPGRTPHSMLYDIGDPFEEVNGYRGGQLIVVS